jgi:drug/metabolite transporter (DMT)-like permease
MALLSAFLFGASTPAAKVLLNGIEPLLLAGLLYFGSGLGLGAYSLIKLLLKGQKRETQEAHLKRADLPWLAGAVLVGGVLGPVLLLLGLKSVSASSASLLLNLESVLTALLAWFAFRENVDRRVALGMLSIVLGGVILCAGSGGSFRADYSIGGLFIIGACLCWAIDNNLTRKIANANPIHIAVIKGVVAGFSNLSLALMVGISWPPMSSVLSAFVVGLLGYGISLSLFIRALRDLGAARTGAYFSVAPFIGAVLSVFILHDPSSPQLLLCGVLMAFGVWLHITEQHEHLHVHAPLEHEHMHKHDQHHQHDHAPSIDLREPHSHTHRHEGMVHSHVHFPDAHHSHNH